MTDVKAIFSIGYFVNCTVTLLCILYFVPVIVQYIIYRKVLQIVESRHSVMRTNFSVESFKLILTPQPMDNSFNDAVGDNNT
jgi:hypothetical protein